MTAVARYCQRCGEKLTPRPGERPSRFANRRLCAQGGGCPSLRTKWCELCGAEYQRKNTEGKVQWEGRRYCSIPCSEAARRGESAPALPDFSGPWIKTEDREPPCYMNPLFHKFEKELVSRRETRNISARKGLKEYTRNMVTEARRRWCGTCPLLVSCENWARADTSFEGVAAGHWFSGGEVLV